MQDRRLRHAFTLMAKLQPEYADRLFARKRSEDQIHLSDIVDHRLCLRLLRSWANEFEPPGDGVEREARLVGGAEVFASYLSNLPSVTPSQQREAVEQFRRAQRQHNPAVFRIQEGEGALPIYQQQETQAHDGQTAFLTDIFPHLPPLLQRAAQDVVLPLLGKTPPSHAYQGCVIGMLVGGCILLSKERSASASDRGERATMVLGLAGAALGFFPPAGAAVGLTVAVGGTLIREVVKHHTRKHDAAEHAARRFASAMILDSNHASTEFGNIVLAAINSVRG